MGRPSLCLCCSKRSASERQNDRGQPYKCDTIERNASEGIKAIPGFYVPVARLIHYLTCLPRES